MPVRGWPEPISDLITRMVCTPTPIRTKRAAKYSANGHRFLQIKELERLHLKEILQGYVRRVVKRRGPHSTQAKKPKWFELWISFFKCVFGTHNLKILTSNCFLSEALAILSTTTYFNRLKPINCKTAIAASFFQSNEANDLVLHSAAGGGAESQT